MSSYPSTQIKALETQIKNLKEDFNKQFYGKFFEHTVDVNDYDSYCEYLYVVGPRLVLVVGGATPKIELEDCGWRDYESYYEITLEKFLEEFNRNLMDLFSYLPPQ